MTTAIVRQKRAQNRSERKKWFSLKKWFLFFLSLMAMIVTTFVQMVALANQKQWAWPILLSSTLLLLLYNLNLFAAYHNALYCSLAATVGLYFLTAFSIVIAFTISDSYWLSAMLSSATFTVGVNFTVDLYDARNHVFEADDNPHEVNRIDRKFAVRG